VVGHGGGGDMVVVGGGSESSKKDGRLCSLQEDAMPPWTPVTVAPAAGKTHNLLLYACSVVEARRDRERTGIMQAEIRCIDNGTADW
jgi:hypothetical protein